MNESDTPILPWRFAVGMLLHLAVPAYLITLAGGLFLNGDAHFSAATVAIGLGISWRFLLGYSAFIATVAIGARTIDPLLRRRRKARRLGSPATAAQASAQRAARVVPEIEQLAILLQVPRLLALASVFRDGRWSHEDARFQSLSADLASATAAFKSAGATATASERSKIADLAEDALDQIAVELARLSSGRRNLDFDNAEVAARYIAARYGPSDFAGEPRS